jgi:hypothetical protein
LTERVEKLERLIAGRNELLKDPAPMIGTKGAYWFCVGGHAFLTFLFASSEALLMFGVIFWLGSIATLAVCHVLPVRPMHLRVLRTGLSVLIVYSAGLCGLWFGEITDLQSVMGPTAFVFPIVFVVTCLVAKSFVWIRGWRILAPGQPDEMIKLKISHLMGFTLLFATYLAFARLYLTEEFVEANEIFSGTITVLVPVVCCTLFSCFLARQVLLRRNPHRFRDFGILFGLGSLVIFGVIAVFSMVGESGMETVLGVTAGYVLPCLFGVLASSGLTFAVMRSAGYRFASGRASLAKNQPQEASP